MLAGRQLTRILTGLAVFAVAAGLAGCKPREEEGIKRNPSKEEKGTPPKAEQTFLTPVVVKAIVRGEIRSTVATTGSIVPIRSRLLSCEEAGRLHFERRWQEGDYVERDVLIAKIQSDTLTQEIDRSKADLQIQRESLQINGKSKDSAVREYEILQGLYSRGIAAQKDVESTQLRMEQAVNSYRQGQINLSKATTALKVLEDRLERLEVRAPFDGLLVSRATLDGSKPFATTFGSETIVDYDNRLVASGFAVCGIIDTTRVIIRCDVTSKDIDRLRPEQESTATIYAAKDVTLTGKVAEIGRAVNQETRAFRVDVVVENPDRFLRPGMFARVDIVTDRRRETISISKEYIVQRNNRSVVFVADKVKDTNEYLAREVPIEVGLEGRDEIEVTEGLKAGDLLVIRGFEVLQAKTPLSILRSDEAMKPGMDDKKTTETIKPKPIPTPAKKGS